MTKIHKNDNYDMMLIFQKKNAESRGGGRGGSENSDKCVQGG